MKKVLELMEMVVIFIALFVLAADVDGSFFKFVFSKLIALAVLCICAYDLKCFTFQQEEDDNK